MAVIRWPVDVVARTQRCGLWTGCLVGIFLASSLGAVERVRVAANLDRPRALAVSANGQTVVAIVGKASAIMAGDPTRDEPWREVVSRADESRPQPVAVGVLPGDVVVTVCRHGDDWILQTYRLKPEEVAEASEPLQVVPLGKAAGAADDVALAVHRSRGWLVVTGLPHPLPAVLRCAVAGVRVGPPSDRGCPKMPVGHRPITVATRSSGGMVLVSRSQTGDDAIGFYDAAGKELLNLPTGLKMISAIDMTQGDSMLWAVGASGDGRTGLWRLDAAFRDHRQGVQPVLVCPLTDRRAMVSVTDRAIVLIDGDVEPGLWRVDLPNPEVLDPMRGRP